MFNTHIICLYSPYLLTSFENFVAYKYSNFILHIWRRLSYLHYFIPSRSNSRYPFEKYERHPWTIVNYFLENDYNLRQGRGMNIPLNFVLITSVLCYVHWSLLSPSVLQCTRNPPLPFVRLWRNHHQHLYWWQPSFAPNPHTPSRHPLQHKPAPPRLPSTRSQATGITENG